MRLRRVTEWTLAYPGDHILAELGGGTVTTNEANIRAAFEQWRRVALLCRRVWRLETRWKTIDIKGWDYECQDWRPRSSVQCDSG